MLSPFDGPVNDGSLDDDLEAEPLPPDLEEGGLVEAHLRGDPQPGESQTMRQLRDRLLRDLDDLRRELRYPDFCDRNNTLDPVLEYLARREGGAGKELRVSALGRYRQQPDDYDQVLGNLVPADLRDEARRQPGPVANPRGGGVTVASDWPAYLDGLRARRERGRLGLLTGLACLDDALGGLRGLTFLGGGPGVGKTTLALTLAAGALRQHTDIAVLYYSLEPSMASTVLLDRLLCAESGVDYRALLSWSGQDQERLEQAGERLRRTVLPRLRIVDAAALGADGSLTAALMHQHRRELLAETGASLALIVIDYFQLLDPGQDVGAGLDADYARVALLQQAQTCTRTAERPGGDPLLVISEVRKGEGGRAELTAADLMGSARLGYAADAVLLLTPPRADGPAPDAETVPLALKVAKGRDGMVRTDLRLRFSHTRSRFEELARATPTGKGNVPPARKGGDRKKDPMAGGRGD